MIEPAKIKKQIIIKISFIWGRLLNVVQAEFYCLQCNLQKHNQRIANFHFQLVISIVSFIIVGEDLSTKKAFNSFEVLHIQEIQAICSEVFAC